MKFYSTNNPATRVSLKEAVLKGLADDNGLFMPETIPALPEDILRKMPQMSFTQIAFEMAYPFLKDDFSEKELRSMIEDAYNFSVPVVEVEKNIYSAELFDGPTLAFKDFGARFMARILGHFTRDEKQTKDIHVLVATSGDTGSAVANGFLGVEGVKVHVLYPKGLVSPIQEKQFTTLGRNITALEIDGTFDDAQGMVKAAFLDKELRSKLILTSANSINLGRLLPQMFYYAYVWSRLACKASRIVASVPSGNFGNLTAGLIAWRMGIPIAHFIAATNVNDIVPQYLETAVYKPRPSVSTIANAMDVGNPSNFARMLDLFGHSQQKMAAQISGFRYTDQQIKTALKDVFMRTAYLCDPHGTIGYLALKDYLKQDGSDTAGFFLETAHPAKFIETVEAVTGQRVEIPEHLQAFVKGTKQSIGMSNHFEDLKKYLLSK